MQPVREQPEASNTQQEPERDDRGRFGKGNRGGPGNPFARQVALLRKAAMEAVTPEDIRAIMESLKEKARAGDVAAAKLVLSYSCGKPANTTDPDTLDQHELKTMVNNTVPDARMIDSIIQGMPLEAMLLMLRTMLPALFEAKMATAQQMFAEPPEPEEPEDQSPALSEQEAEEDTVPDYLEEILAASKARQRKARSPKTKGLKKELRKVREQLADLTAELRGQREQPEHSTPAMAARIAVRDGSGPIANGRNGELESP